MRRARYAESREFREDMQERNRKQVLDATEAYVKATYRLPPNSPPELIEAYRISLFIKREIRKQKNEQETGNV